VYPLASAGLRRSMHLCVSVDTVGSVDSLGSSDPVGSVDPPRSRFGAGDEWRMSRYGPGQVRPGPDCLSRPLVRHHVRYLGPCHAATRSCALRGRTARYQPGPAQGRMTPLGSDGPREP
jgi:hypothetical protein